MRIEELNSLLANDYIFGSLGSGNVPREMVRWLFDSDTNVGDVSPEVYSFSDPRLYYDNKYVAIGLKSIEKAGLRSVESARSEVEAILINKMKGEKIIDQISGSDLNAIAGQFGSSVSTVSGVNFGTSNGEGLGFEPDVVATAMKTGLNETSKAVIGKTGVFLVQPTNKVDAPALSNIPFARNTTTNSMRSQVNFKLIEALKNKADISDQRYLLNM